MFARGELKRRGVPASAVAVVEGESIDEWDDFRLLATWLKARPDATVAVASNPFSSRRVRYMLDAAIGAAGGRPRSRLPSGRSPMHRGQLAAKPIRGQAFHVFLLGPDLCLGSWVGPADAAAAERRGVSEGAFRKIWDATATKSASDRCKFLEGIHKRAPPPSGRGHRRRDRREGRPFRILLVTNGYHTRRARWIFTEVLDGQAATVLPISVPTDEFAEESWWRSERGFAAIAGECLKLGFYRLRYGKLGCLAAGAALLWLGWRAFRRKPLVVNNLGVVV